MDKKQEDKCSVGSSKCLFISKILIAILSITTIYFGYHFYKTSSKLNNKYAPAVEKNHVATENIEDYIERKINQLYSMPRISLLDDFDRSIRESQRIFSNNSHYITSVSRITANENEYNIILELAGFSKDEINIELKHNRLIITANKKTSGENKDQKNTDYYENRNYKQVIQLADDIDTGSIKSDLNNGILTINIPRTKTEPKSITLPINVEKKNIDSKEVDSISSN